MKNILLSIILILSFCVSVFGGTTDPNVPDSSYTDYGQKFKCVVRLCGRSPENILYCGSAVVIDKHWVVTAAHVVHNLVDVKIKNLDNKEYHLSEIIVHKGFVHNNFGYNDIALGYCEQEIDCDFIPQLYSENNEIGKVCAIAGFGIHGTFLTGTKNSDSKIRGGSNIIDKLDRDLLICTPSRSHDRSRTSLEFIIGHGDSGGGLFIDQKLAGVNSCVLATDGKADSSYGDESGHTRVSKFIPWIKQTMNDKAKIINNSVEVSTNYNHYQYIILISMLIMLNMICFCLGYLWCKTTIDTVDHFNKSPKLITKQHLQQNSHSMEIDSSKVVVDIKTDNLEKKYQTLGEVKKTDEDISGSISKLKNLSNKR